MATGASPVLGQHSSSEDSASALIDQSTLPAAPELKGGRPRIKDGAVAPAATELPPPLLPLTAPPSLALPDQNQQVSIHELRPLTLEDALLLAEVNSPTLKAAASQTEQAKSSLRAAISSWYPKIDLSASGLPEYFKSYSFQNPDFVPDRVVQKNTGAINPLTGAPEIRNETRDGYNERYGREWRVNASLQVSWDIINPRRVPEIAAARDQYEQARDSYAIALRDLRLNTSTDYFNLQEADEGVRIGQASVRASLVSLRDARARFNAGVNTKLEVLEAETQLARDRNILTSKLGDQDTSRRLLASKLDLPQDITPTAATPARPLGSWQPSLQESIVAAFNFREELDSLLLKISINNSEANASLAAVQPVLSFVNTSSTSRREGQSGITSLGDIDMDDYVWSVQNSTSLRATWRLFDGGRARAEYRRFKQAAEESAYRFARARDSIRLEVEQSFFGLRTAVQNIQTTGSEVLSARESLRLSQLRVQAGVSTQREVVNNQRDLTNAELRYAGAIRDYNTSLAQLRRRTGLDALVSCSNPVLPSVKSVDNEPSIPIEPTPLKSVCPAMEISTAPIDTPDTTRSLW
ncbi:TolC family protein [Synechococcus sp. BL107]|uniref:TolC family protein n=1 Tax=Synechococcus sp. BL107 TaxID=313625 RepID=UPI000903084F|nr:TolC family protein [Synechococcus sp. BL107]